MNTNFFFSIFKFEFFLNKNKNQMDWIKSAGRANRETLGLTWWVATDGGLVRHVKR